MTRAAIAAVAAVGSAVASAQEPFRSAVDLVRVTATVFDREGRFVPGLTVHDFRIVDDGKEQPIVVFSAEPQPVSVVFLMDVSQSMVGGAYAEARKAVELFIQSHLGPTDEVLACVFNDSVSCLQRWTRDPAPVGAAFASLLPTGGTRLYDAVEQVIPRMEGATHSKRALIIMSDGSDTASRGSAHAAREALRRAELVAYAIGFRPTGTLPTDTVSLVPQHGGAFAGVNLRALRSLTETTGGRALYAGPARQLSAAVREIANELRHQYHLGYQLPRAPDGRYYEIKVTARANEYEVRARRGYVALRRTR